MPAQHLKPENPTLREAQDADAGRLTRDPRDPLGEVVSGPIDADPLEGVVDREPGESDVRRMRQRCSRRRDHEIERKVGGELEEVALVAAVAVQQDQVRATRAFAFGGTPEHVLRFDRHPTTLVATVSPRLTGSRTPRG